VTFSSSGSAVRKSRAFGGDGIRAQKNTRPRKRTSSSTSAENSVTERALKIGEAAQLVGVESYVLRFWETQFSFIRPRQSRSRHRYYSQGDIETLKIVKHLLHTEGYTIAGARRFVRENGLDGVKNRLPPQLPASSRRTNGRSKADSEDPSPDAPLSLTSNGVYRALREIREDLRELHKLLETC